MAKMVDARDLKSVEKSRAGSSPAERTKCTLCGDRGYIVDPIDKKAFVCDECEQSTCSLVVKADRS